MAEFASRTPGRDASRRAAWSALRHWAFPLGLLCAWVAAAAFSVSALDSAGAAWKSRLARRMPVVEVAEQEVVAVVPARRAPTVRPAALPECPSARARRAPQAAIHPG
jgi:hypothetical protein